MADLTLSVITQEDPSRLSGPEISPDTGSPGPTPGVGDGTPRTRRARPATRTNISTFRHAAARPIWTIMVYLAGDNDLSPAMVWALNEIGSINLPPDLAVTIQYDPRSALFKTLRYKLDSRTRRPKGELKSHYPLEWALVDTIPAEDTGSASALARFITWSRSEYRHSQSYTLILSGHGSGIVGDFLGGDGRDPRRSSLSVGGLTLALEKARAELAEDLVQKNGSSTHRKLIDILGMDSCLMSMAEVCSEVKDHVSYVVGSEGFSSSAGWPYGELLRQCAARARKAARLGSMPKTSILARHFVDTYLNYYRDRVPAGVSADLAACQTDRVDALEESMRRLTDLLCTYGAGGGPQSRQLWDLVILAHWWSQSFKLEQYADLWDFCSQLKEVCGRNDRFKAVRSACQGVIDAVAGLVGERQDYVGIQYQHAHGLSVFFPWSCGTEAEQDTLERYCMMRFARNSGWGAFLKDYLRETRRAPREGVAPRGIGDVADGRTAVARSSGGAHRYVPEINRYVPEINRYVPEINRYVPEINRGLLSLYGERLPWSMKNPPQVVPIRPPRVTRS